MKKSEIIELINAEVNLSDSDIKKILHVIEKAGMLPPPDGVEAVTQTIVYAYYNERVTADDEYKPLLLNLWEPE